ncbi:MAG TPA: response regulator, partial [Candidatus Saccharimonadales bacterium]|nr:response regulator [Candidatus Saccharimonadales bacterium]
NMNPTAPPLKVVIVEDNTSLADIYKTRLEALGYTCFAAYDGEQALATIQRELPSLVLLDLMVPKIAGDQILSRMRGSDWGKDIKVLIISNLNEADAPAGLREQGIEGYAVKANLTNDELDHFVDRILKPEDQTEDVMLETKGSESYPVVETVEAPAAPVVAPPSVGAAPFSAAPQPSAAAPQAPAPQPPQTPPAPQP